MLVSVLVYTALVLCVICGNCNVACVRSVLQIYCYWCHQRLVHFTWLPKFILCMLVSFVAEKVNLEPWAEFPILPCCTEPFLSPHRCNSPDSAVSLRPGHLCPRGSEYGVRVLAVGTSNGNQFTFSLKEKQLEWVLLICISMNASISAKVSSSSKVCHPHVSPASAFPVQQI